MSKVICQRNLSTGRFISTLFTNSEMMERLLTKSTMNQKTSCLEWNGSLNPQGYGLISYKGKSIGTHRLMWRLTYGAIPDSLFVLHKCDNPLCLNIQHLFLGTAKDNVHDAIRKGRMKPSEIGKLAPHPSRFSNWTWEIIEGKRVWIQELSRSHYLGDCLL